MRQPPAKSPLDATDHDDGVGDHGCSRRDVLRGASIATVAVGAGLSLGACSDPSPTTVTVPTADVPVGGGLVLDEAKYVVTQPTAGQYQAFSKICPHAGCKMSAIEAGQIVCKCHGGKFAITDGAVLAGPSKKSLVTVKVANSGKTLTVTA